MNSSNHIFNEIQIKNLPEVVLVVLIKRKVMRIQMMLKTPENEND